MIEGLFIELSIIIIIATIIACLMRLLKQPLIIGYVLTGIIVSPHFLNLIPPINFIGTFAQIGVALLLFMVGLNLNPKLLKDIGRISLILGICQVILTFIIGLLLALFLGFSIWCSIFLGIGFTFSSTIIILKLLSDRGDMETLYGRISTGLLIVQDIIVIFILMFISSISAGTNLSNLLFETLLKGVGLLGLLFATGIYILPKVTKIIAKSQELLLLFSLGWCFALSILFYYLNFSIEIGALLAGITLALSPYRYEIGCKLKPLRDFFLILFFILLGSQITLSSINQYIIPIIIFSIFVLFGKPIIVTSIMGLLGYTKRTSFLTGLTNSQISEFSMILMALLVNYGFVANKSLSLITIVGLITIAGSSYFIIYSNKVYNSISKYLNIFERKGKKIDEHRYRDEESYDVILFGYNRIGYDILESLKKINKRFLVVDYNPETIIDLIKQGFNCRYGDANDLELLNELNLKKPKMIISTIPSFDTNTLLISKVKEVNKKAIIMVVSHKIEEAMRLYEKGATYVIMPHFLGGHHASMMIEEYGFNMNKFLKEKLAHINHLKNRKIIGHEHPRHERE